MHFGPVAHILGMLLMFVFAGGVFVMSEIGLDMATSFGAVAATLSNIGPGLGGVGRPTTTLIYPSSVSGCWRR